MSKAVDDRKIAPRPGLDAESVREWLIANPDFLDRNIDLLIARDAGNAETVPGVVDLRHRILEGLRRSLERQKVREREILLAAEDRARTAARTQDAVLLVLRQSSLNALAQRVASQFPVLLFSTTAASLIVEGEPESGHGDLMALSADAIDKLIRPGEEVRLGAATESDRGVLGDRFSLVESLAVIRLGTRRGRFLLALGSSAADGFTADQGTDLLDFLGSVLEVAIDRWPRRRR